MKREPVEMLVLNSWRHEADVIGLEAVPNRFDGIARLPGETVAQMVRRALHAVRGAGQLLVYPTLRS
jgi:hypothetical protein